MNRYWHIYVAGPIDLHWECLRTVKETYKIMYKEYQDLYDSSPDMSPFIVSNHPDLEGLMSMYERVKSLASKLNGVHFDGDMRSESEQRVFWVVSPDPLSFEFEYGFVWKQDNNGICFIASPVEMPWLEDEYSPHEVFDMFDTELVDEQNEGGSNTYVYVIESVGVGKVKIGLSSEPEKRLKQLQTGSSHKLKLLLVIPGTSILEHDLHAKFSHIRAEGEWFYATKELREWIESHAEQNDGI